MDNAAANRPMRRTALVAKELSRYNIQICALSETRFADEGQLKEIGSGYTFFWSGRKQEERREADVGFAIETTSSITYPAYLKVTTTDSCPFDFPSSKDVILPSSVHTHLP